MPRPCVGAGKRRRYAYRSILFLGLRPRSGCAAEKTLTDCAHLRKAVPALARDELLHALHVGRLQSLGALLHFETDARALFERAIAVTQNGREVNEYILAAFALDESVAFRGVEPFDGTLFLHAANILMCGIAIC